MFRTIFGFFQSIVMIITALFMSGQWVGHEIGCYMRRLDRMGIYDNRTRDSIPITEVHDIVYNHFARERDDGREPRALLVVYDGARADVLVNTVDYENSAIFRLQREGGRIYHMHAGGPMFNRQGTDTAQGFASMLTGRWAGGRGGHGVFQNSYTKAVYPPLIFQTLLENDHTDGAAFVVSWGGHFTRTNAEGVGTANYSNDVALFQELGLTDADDVTQGAMRWLYHLNDDGSVATTMELLEDADGPGFIALSLEHVDSAGHYAGFGNHVPRYVEAFRESERVTYAMIDAIQARPTYDNEDWLILIASDHGGMGYSHGMQFAVVRQVFLVANQDIASLR